MTSRPDSPPTTLSESWATLSTSDIHSEDDAHSIRTDTASLVGLSVADDIASLDENDDLPSDADSTDVDSHCSDQEFLPQLYLEPAADSTNLASAMTFRSASDPIFLQEFDTDREAHDPNAPPTLLKHTLCWIDKADLERPARDMAMEIPGDVLGTVYLTASRQGLDHKGPFRVLYVGSSEFKGPVLDKLGDILIANPTNTSPSSSAESSRYHVVPTAFGPNSAPSSAELLPLNVQLVVDECATAYDDEEEPGKVTLVLKNGNRYSTSRDGRGSKISSDSEWVAPDLAIFFLANSDIRADMRTRHKAYYFLLRHGVPCMFISETPLWNKGDPLFPVNLRSVHIALEAYDQTANQMTVIGRCPIDLDTFERIAPEQLNKGLAALLAPREESSESSDRHKSNAQATLDIEKYPKNSDFVRSRDTRDMSVILGNILTVMIGLIVLLAGYAAVKGAIIAVSGIFSFGSCMLWSRCDGSSLAPSSTAPITVPAVQTMAITPVLTTTTDVGIPVCGAGKSLSINDFIAEISRPIADKPNESETFQVHVIGDCHLIIKAPSTGRRKNPKFGVKVTRAETELSFDLSRLFDGVYSLRLAREDAYGLVKVNITTKTKPFLDQVTEVDFGTPWLKIANWKKAAQVLSSRVLADLNSAQVGLLEAYNRVAPDLNTMTQTLRREVEHAGPPLKRALKSAAKFARKSRQLYDDMRSGAGPIIDPTLIPRLHERAEILHQTAVGYFNAAVGEMNDQAKRVHHMSLRQRLTHLRRRAREFARFRSLANAQQQAYEIVHWRRWQTTFQCTSSRRRRGTTFR